MKSKKNKNKNKNKSKGSSRLLHYPSEITQQLSNLLYNSQLTNTWDRFDSSVNEQLNVNQHMMENLEYPSLLQPLNNNYNNH